MQRITVEGGWNGIVPKFTSSHNQENQCLPACVSMVLKTAGMPCSRHHLDEITGYQPKYYSQFSTATLALNEYFPDNVHLYSLLDFTKYSRRGEKYLRQIYEPDWFKDQKAHSSPGFEKETQAAAQLVERRLSTKVPEHSLDLVRRLLQDNLLIASVDTAQLYRFKQVSSHAVLVYGTYENMFVFADPEFSEYDGKCRVSSQEEFSRSIRTHVLAIQFPRVNLLF